MLILKERKCNGLGSKIFNDPRVSVYKMRVPRGMWRSYRFSCSELSYFTRESRQLLMHAVKSSYDMIPINFGYEASCTEERHFSIVG